MRMLTTVAAVLALQASAVAAPSPKSSTTRSWVASLDALRPAADVPVNLDLENAPVREALRQVFDQAKQEYVVENDVPETARVTARARDIKLYTALDLITQAAGVHWSHDVRDGKPIFRVGKSVTPNRAFRFFPSTAGIITDNLNKQFRIQTRPDLLFRGSLPSQLFTAESRSTFTCPHCKGRATVITQRQQTRCPRCERVFQADWQFCPADGTRRPAAPPTQWRHCPLCGKEVRTESTRRAD